MASGKIQNKTTFSGTINGSTSLNASVAAGSGTTDHSRLANRASENQHPIEAITDLRKELDSKLEASTALPLIEEAIEGKAKGLYFDAKKELAKKSYWYLTAEIDPVTKMGTKDSIISGPYDLGAGGGSGGGGGVTVVSIQKEGWLTTTVVGSTTKLKVRWISTIGDDKAPTGTGTLYLTVNGKQVEIKAEQPQGVVEFDVTKYIIAGANNVQVKVIDSYGTQGITIGTLNAITLELKSSFNANLNYTDTINYTYVPYGDVDKTVYFIVDGKEKGTQLVKSTGESQTFRITGLTHGSHMLEVYFKALVNGVEVKSNSLFYDLIYYVAENKTPIIASTFNELEQEQYISFNIPYRVYVEGKNEFEVSFLVNDEEINKTTVSSAEQYWNYLQDVPGDYKLTIKCGTTTKTFNIHVNKSTINVVPVSQDLVLALSTQGRNNNEEATARSKWIDSAGNLSCELTNFNWKSNGWVTDLDGNSILRVSGDARIKIPFQAFSDDFKNRGKTIELEIATSAVRNYSTTLISCLDKQSTDFFEVSTSFVEEDFRKNTFKVSLNNEKLKNSNFTTGIHVFSFNGTSWVLDSEKEVVLDDYGITIASYEINPEGTYEDKFILNGDNITINYTLAARGFYVTPQVAVFRSQQSAISTQYKEDEHVRISFVVEKNTDNRVIWMYINGIASGAMQYPVDDNFRQLEPNFIEIGSNDAVLDIYNIRIYDNNLNSKQIVNNWIADTQNATLRAARYYRNDNYNDKNEIVISKLPADLPHIIWDIDPLPEFKGDKRLGNAEYTDPTDSTRDFTSERAQYNVQGTSSSVYPTKNIRIKFKAKDGDPNFFWLDKDGNTIKKFAITYPGGIGDNYFTFKVDFASSEGANNVELTKLYNDTCKELGILTPPQRVNSKVRVGIDGFPIVAFHRNSDGKDVFCTKANFNNDKANEDVYGFAAGDESWETTNNSADETKYKIPAGEENFDNGFEIRFPDADDWNGDVTKLKAMTTWVASTNRDLATNEALPEEVTYTYEEVTVGEDNSEAVKKVTKTFTHDTKEYRLAKFRVELPNWFNVDSTLFYYVFTHLYLMIDSRAKNAFPTYFATRKTSPITDDKGQVIDENTFEDNGNRWFWIPYDMDTAIGIDNKGKLSFDYNLEDTDKLDGADVFNGQDSVMWCNLRDSMPGEIKAMYAKMRLSGLISYEETEKRFEEHQGKWSENIFNEDAKNKYITPLANGDNYLEMLQGSKSQQRKWWLYNRFKYMDSKYNAGEAIKDFVQFRAYVDEGMEKPNITITPYADIYATVSYANGRVVAKRAKRNEPIIIENPFSTSEKENDQETYIYSASQLKSIGDISGFRPDTVKIGNAVKLQELKVGDKDPNYQNPHLRELTVGNNTLLKSLDARNCINLGAPDEQGKIATPAPDLSKCINIEEIYFEGTQIKGIVLPDGGNIKVLHLPATLTSLTIKNQPLLNDLVLAGTENIESLWLENIPSTSIKSEVMVSQMKANTAIRLIGINETYNSYEEIKHFYDLLDGKKGIAADSTIVDKVQITGTINIDTIAYADKIALEARYPEVKIKANQILCTVIFKNEGKLFNTKVVINGTSISAEEIGVPSKASTAQHYYTFNSWDKSLENIQTDLIINAIFDEHIQQYSIIFNTQSSVIKVDPQEITLYYGESIPSYKEDNSEFVVISDIPEQVYFLGWIRKDSHEPWGQFNDEGIWEFGDTPIVGPIELLAKWDDKGAPHIDLTRLNAYDFEINGHDNVGITAWAVVRDTTEVPTDWTYLEEAVADLNLTYTTNGAGTYYVWVKDAQNNVYSSSIVAYSIERIEPVDELNSEVFAIMNIREDSIDGTILNHDYALAGTNVYLDCWIDNHYENKEIYINNNIVTDNLNHTIYSDSTFELACTPCIYSIVFRTERGDIPAPQNVTYLHKINHPDPQADNSYIIKDWWVLDKNENRLYSFDFETMVVTSDLILEANWIEYHLPTTFKIVTTEANQEVKLRLTLRYPAGGSGFINGGSIRVEWECYHDADVDESDYYDEPSWQLYTSETNYVELSHTYEIPGEYTLKIASVDTPYYFGTGQSGGNLPAIDPINILTYIDFAWDTPYPNAYAFAGASGLQELVLTQYMVHLENYSFSNCVNLKRVYLPNNFYSLGDGVFSDCWSLKVVGYNALDPEATKSILPMNLNNVGRAAFQKCTELIEVDFTAAKEAVYFGESVFINCSSLQHVYLPENTTSIPDYFFMSCANLQSIELKENISSIGRGAFTNCKKLSKVILHNPNVTIGSTCFSQCPLLNTAGPIGTTDSTGLPVDLEFAWTTIIPDYAFSSEYGGSTWKEIYLPITIESIGYQAFINCGKLTYFNINDLSKLTYIGARALERTNISSIILSETVNLIGYNAFAYCTLSAAYLKTIAVDGQYIDGRFSKPTQPQDSWFYSCVKSPTLYISRNYYQQFTDPATLTFELTNNYGTYWNYVGPTTTLKVELSSDF